MSAPEVSTHSAAAASDPVCPQCGSAAAGNRYCSVCGLALFEQGGLPARSDWERAKAEGKAEGDQFMDQLRSIFKAGTVLSALWMAGLFTWVALTSPDSTEPTTRNYIIGALSVVAIFWLWFAWDHSEGRTPYYQREAIPQAIKEAVWTRDDGRCVYCGGRERLEFDHIIPVSKGGSSTDRNLQLLCLSCNRRKHASI